MGQAVHKLRNPCAMNALRRGWESVRRAALAWLLLALVLVPTVGQLHKVLHLAPHAGQGRAMAVLRAHGLDVRGTAAGAVGAIGVEAGAEAQGALSPGAAAASEKDFSQGLRRLLPQHTAADCELLDQLALGQALHAAALVLPTALPPGAPAARPLVGRVVRHVAAFRARAPPTR